MANRFGGAMAMPLLDRWRIRRDRSPGGRQWLFALAGCAAIVMGWFSDSPVADPAAQGIASTLTVVSANIQADNNDLGALHRWVQYLKADIVVIQEVSTPPAEKLEIWLDYPHR